MADLLDLLKNGAVSNFPEEDVSLHSEVCQAEVLHWLSRTEQEGEWMSLSLNRLHQRAKQNNLQKEWVNVFAYYE